MGQTARREPGRHRCSVTAIVVGVAALTCAVFAPGQIAGADTRPDFVRGDGKATAGFFDLKLQITGSTGGAGGLAIGFGSGKALAEYHDDGAAAEGRALDYSLLSLLNPQPTAACPDIIPLFLASTEPPKTRADSSDPAAANAQPVQVRYAGFPTYGDVFGTQAATADATPTSKATTDAPDVQSGVVGLSRAHSESTVRVSGHTREAIAKVSADNLTIMGGALTLFNPVWTATARSGDITTSDATFTYSGASILGVQRPGNVPGDLTFFKNFVESTFAFLGMHVIFPTATIDTSAGASIPSVSISPLQVTLDNLPIGQSLLGPILHAISPQIDQALKSYLAQKCSNQGLQLLSDVLLNLVSGRGGMSFALGGATAMTDDTYTPPLDLSLPSNGSNPPVAPPTASIASAFTPAAATPRSRSTSTAIDVPATTESVPVAVEPASIEAPVPGKAEVAAAAPAYRPVQRAAAERSTPGHTGGAAGWATAAVVFAALSLAGADHMMMRRSTRRMIG